MADRGETIRDLLQGFNAMQQQLGLLPPQNNSSPMGIGLPAPLPPPPVPHPGQVSLMANQMGMSGAQQTLSAAQQTRYIPPPSTPIFNPMSGGGMLSPSLGAISGGQFNPYMANMMGGGAMSMPSPIYNTPHQYGGYRPGAPPLMPMASGFATPSVFNPFASGVPGPQFMMPSAQAHALHQSYSSQAAAMAVGGAAGLANMGGSMLGAAAFGGRGLLGMIGGGIAGGLVGMGASSLVNLMARPYLREVGMGNMVADQSRSFMVGGAFMGPGGAGFDMGSSRQVARGLIGFGRDPGMQRELGFNTNDYSRIFSMAGQHGMLDMAQNPEQVLNQVKNVAKSVKAFMQIAQEPDVREAMRMMGQFRSMGMNLQESNAAAFNARQFSRMAGVSMQAGMNMFGNPGAAMAQGIGLSGGLGFNVGMASGGMARLAVAGGAFNEQQLAMAGGVQGLAQINTTSGLAATNLNAVLPGLLRNQGGKLSIDQDLLRKYQSGGLSIRDLTQMGAQNMRDWGQNGIENIVTQMQEQKDSLGRMLGPQGAQMLALRQAMDIRRETGGTLGGAFMKLGYGAEQARALELQYSSRGFWDNQSRQMQAEAQDQYDRTRSMRARYRSPSNIQRLRRGFAGALNAIGDAASSPFRDVGNYLEHAAEDRAAWDRGATITRFDDDQLMSSAEEEERVARYMETGGYRRVAARREGVTSSRFGSGGNLSMIGASLGISSLGGAGRDEYLFRQATGGHTSGVAGFASSVVGLFTPSVSPAQKRARVESSARAGSALKEAEAATRQSLKLARDDVQRKGGLTSSRFDRTSMEDAAAGALLKTIDKYHDGTFSNAESMTDSDIRSAIMQGLQSQGMSASEAEQFYNANKASLHKSVLDTALTYASDKDKEVIYNTMETAERDAASGGIGKHALTQIKQDQSKQFAAMGVAGATGSIAGAFGALGKNQIADSKNIESAFRKYGTEDKALSLAALRKARQSAKDPAEIAKIDAQVSKLTAGLSDQEKSALEDRSRNIARGLSQEELRDVGKAAANLAASGGDVGGSFAEVQKLRLDAKGVTAMKAYAGRHKDIRGLSEFAEDKTDLGTALGSMTDEDIQKLKDTGQAGMAQAAELYRKDKTKGLAAAMGYMTRHGDASKKTMVGGMEVTPEMAGRMAGFEQMREEALASGDIQSAGAAALNTAADKLNMAADKMLESSKQTEALSFWDRARATLS